MPKFSIIIPMFNSSSYIEKCLHSIRIQSFRDYELVLQDDASSDETVDVAMRFRDANPGMDIKVFRGEHKGIYGAMNSGCRQASGEWLYFLGSDDELHDRSVLSTVMGNPAMATSNVIYGNVQVVGDAASRNMATVYDGVFDLAKLLKKNICHQAIFYRATFFRQIGDYNPRYSVWADWDFNMRCWAQTEFRYLDRIVANFYAGGTSGKSGDECFRRESAENVLRYFSLSVYDPLVNDPRFVGFDGIVKMQRLWFRKLARPWRFLPFRVKHSGRHLLDSLKTRAKGSGTGAI